MVEAAPRREDQARRVLEKAGYVLEARLRRSAIKNGAITDQLQYAFIAEGQDREGPDR